MNVRAVSVWILPAALLLFPGCTQERSNSETPDWAKPLVAQIESIQQTLENTVTDDELDAVKKDLAKARRDINKNEADFNAATDLFKEQDTLLGELTAKNKSILAMLQESDAQQETLLAAITKKGSDGRDLVDVNAIMDSSSGRQEMAAAVHESLRRRGTLRVENRMDVGYHFLVNGTREYIPGRSTLEFNVPVGTVTTELEGYESPRNWSVGPPDYVHDVVISPRASRSVVLPAPILPSYYYDPFWGWVAL